MGNKMQQQVRQGLLRCIVCFVTVFSLPLYAEQEQVAPTEPEKSEASIPFDEIQVFADIFARVKKDYVESVEDKALMKSAIRGMLSGLDPHSSYLDEEEYQDLHEGTMGEFGGLGIEVGLEDGFIKVI